MHRGGQAAANEGAIAKHLSAGVQGSRGRDQGDVHVEQQKALAPHTLWRKQDNGYGRLFCGGALPCRTSQRFLRMSPPKRAVAWRRLPMLHKPMRLLFAYEYTKAVGGGNGRVCMRYE